MVPLLGCLLLAMAVAKAEETSTTKVVEYLSQEAQTSSILMAERQLPSESTLISSEAISFSTVKALAAVEVLSLVEGLSSPAGGCEGDSCLPTCSQMVLDRRAYIAANNLTQSGVNAQVTRHLTTCPQVTFGETLVIFVIIFLLAMVVAGVYNGEL